MTRLKRFVLKPLKLDRSPNTVKPVYNDHPWNPETVAIVDGRYRQVVTIRMGPLAQV